MARDTEEPTVPEGIEEFDWDEAGKMDLVQLARHGLDFKIENDSAGDSKFNRPVYVEDAGLAGVSSNLLDMVKSGFGSIGKFATDNPELSKMFLGGLSAAQQRKMQQEMQGMDGKQRLEYVAMMQQYAKENAATNNQYRIDAENRKIQEDKALWDRRNANITGMGINAPQALTMAQTQPIIDSILKGRK